MEERLEHIKKKIRGKKVYYSSYNPRSAYMYDVEDAEDDVLWLIAEVERLREAVHKPPSGRGKK
jgi:hypothetical protein